MGSLMAQVMPLAAATAVSPGLLALQMLNLARATAPMARAWSVLAGAAAVVAAVSIGALFVTVGLGDIGRDDALRGAVRLTAAAVLVAVAINALTHRSRPPAPGSEPTDQHRRGLGYATAAALGAGLIAPNMALYLPAAHEIARSSVSTPEKAIALAVVAAIALIPVAGPPVAVAVLGDRVRPPLEALNGFVTRHSRVVTIVLCAGFAVFLAFTGARDLGG